MSSNMLGEVVKKLVELPAEWLGTIYDLLVKLTGKDRKEWLEALKKTLRKELDNPILKLISGAKRITIDAVDGQEILADARDVFAAGIDSGFRSLDADEKGPATDETAVAVYEMANDSSFAQMFTSLGADLRNLCLTQAQIKNFAKKHPNWLRGSGYATFFLFESHSQFFVALVDVHSGDRLLVLVNRFEYSGVWYAEYCLRVVVPQLA